MIDEGAKLQEDPRLKQRPLDLDLKQPVVVSPGQHSEITSLIHSLLEEGHVPHKTAHQTGVEEL